MTAEEKQALTEKLNHIGYSTFETLPGEDDVLMLHVNGSFIGGALYALSLPGEQLKALIDETVAGGEA
jgi:hypothetical protein